MADDYHGAEEEDEATRAAKAARFKTTWHRLISVLLRGEPVDTAHGGYYSRCGRSLGRARFCMQRLGHSAECAPVYANICDAPLPNEKRCVFNAGHKGRCLPVFPRGNG